MPKSLIVIWCVYSVVQQSFDVDLCVNNKLFYILVEFLEENYTQITAGNMRE